MAAARIADRLAGGERALKAVAARWAGAATSGEAVARMLTEEVDATSRLLPAIDGYVVLGADRRLESSRATTRAVNPDDLPIREMLEAANAGVLVAGSPLGGLSAGRSYFGWLDGGKDVQRGGRVLLSRPLISSDGVASGVVAAIFDVERLTPAVDRSFKIAVWDAKAGPPVEVPTIRPFEKVSQSARATVGDFPMVVALSTPPAYVGVSWLGGALSSGAAAVSLVIGAVFGRRRRVVEPVAPAASVSPSVAALEARIAELTSALTDREMLFREMDHRVKNNLQLISSLISLQVNKIEDRGAREAIQASLDRVHSVSLVHELLDRRDAEGFVDLHEYLTGLCVRITRAYLPADRLTCDVDADPVNFTLEVTTRLALVVNEVVTNAVKHAFPNQAKGTITVVFRRGERESRLMIADDGVGMPSRPAGPVDSLGLQLVEMLARYLKGTFQYQSGEFGTVFTLSFPEPGTSPR